ncbi:small secreted protein [Streptomyces sp. ID05-04B]|uniref:small secreted protein n=1 Tax=unclassified Streptomyces TaxID=2593676 RepID=UPI000D19BAC0|nr:MULTISPECIES: small secreted protein [unclassified Streptomyces]AVV41314.1 small secreted protein [Streptomyces sp. P3]MDX5565958.1 small secreted protein [Streptomyces sp. ID05-04B]
MEGTKPVNKKLTAALSGGAVLVLALSGCSEEKDNKELDAWAKTLCATVPAQQAKIKSAFDTLAKAAKDAEPENLQKADSQAFQDLADGFRSRATALQNAGAPPGVDGGAKKQQDAVTKLMTLSTAYANLKKQVDGLETKDQAKFASGLDSVSKQMKNVSAQYKSAVEALQDLEKGDVKRAVADQEGCKKAAASASATDS